MNSAVYDSTIQVVQSGGADSLFAFTVPWRVDLSVHVGTLHQKIKTEIILQPKPVAASLCEPSDKYAVID